MREQSQVVHGQPAQNVTLLDANSLDGTNLRSTGPDLSPLLDGEGLK